jgi:flagellar basal body rod protein FlgC
MGKEFWYVGGALAAVLLLWKFAAKRVTSTLEIDANVYSPTFGEPISSGAGNLTYGAGAGASAALTPQDNTHQRMLQLIEESQNAITAYDTTHPAAAEGGYVVPYVIP